MGCGLPRPTACLWQSLSWKFRTSVLELETYAIRKDPSQRRLGSQGSICLSKIFNSVFPTIKKRGSGLPWRSTVVKNLPANAGDTGSIPDPGRSYMPQSHSACAPPQLLSLCSRARGSKPLSPWPQLLKPTCLQPVLHNRRSHCNEKPEGRD